MATFRLTTDVHLDDSHDAAFEVSHYDDDYIGWDAITIEGFPGPRVRIWAKPRQLEQLAREIANWQRREADRLQPTPPLPPDVGDVVVVRTYDGLIVKGFLTAHE